MSEVAMQSKDITEKSPRIKFTVPVDLAVRSNDDAKKNLKAESVNISKKEIGLISKGPLEVSSIANLTLNLPPCYSEDPKKAMGLEIQAKVIKCYPANKRGRFLSELYILKIKEKDLGILQGIIEYELEKSIHTPFLNMQPKVEIKREPHSCNMYAVNLTIGCENGCKYCHFAKHNQEEWQKNYPFQKKFPIPLDLSPIYKMEHLPESVVYLIPSSEAFAPKAKGLTHELLEYMLPKGVVFTISTKCLIPDKTIKLLKKYSHLIEGIAMGITNLSDERNNLLESGCPSSKERLEHIRKLKEIGCFIGARMDPLFPLIDDTEENLNSTIREIAKAGAQHITGTYLFTFGRYLKKLKQTPQLKESMKLINERTYPLGGVAFSVSTESKMKTYDKMNAICQSHGILFNVCGCKDVSLREANYPLVCRNIDYYKKRNTL